MKWKADGKHEPPNDLERAHGGLGERKDKSQPWRVSARATRGRAQRENSRSNQSIKMSDFDAVVLSLVSCPSDASEAGERETARISGHLRCAPARTSAKLPTRADTIDENKWATLGDRSNGCQRDSASSFSPAAEPMIIRCTILNSPTLRPPSAANCFRLVDDGKERICKFRARCTIVIVVST